MELSLSGTGFAPRKTRGPLVLGTTDPVVTAEEAWELLSAKFASKFKSVREAFIRCDLDCDGSVSDMEFRAVLDALGLTMADEEYKKLWKRFDTSGDGAIDYYEFNNRVGYLIHPVQTTNVLDGRKDTPRVKPWQAKRLAKAMRRKLQNLREAFDEIDMDRSGRVSHAEFIQLLRKLGFTKVDHEESYAMMVAHRDPSNDSGEMTWPEFEKTMREFMSIPDKIEEPEEDDSGPKTDLIHAERLLADKLYGKFAAVQRAFRKFDADHSGTLDYTEFRNALRDMGVNLSTADFKDLMAQYDVSGDGSISYDEFNAKVGPLIHPEAVNRGTLFQKMEEGAGAQEDALHYRAATGGMRADTRSLSARARHIAPALGLSEAEATLAQVLYGKFKEVRSAFRLFDEDKSGELSADEFGMALEHLGIRVRPTVISELMSKYDHNGDGHVSYEEFAKNLGPLLAPTEENAIKLGLKDAAPESGAAGGGGSMPSGGAGRRETGRSAEEGKEEDVKSPSAATPAELGRRPPAARTSARSAVPSLRLGKAGHGAAPTAAAAVSELLDDGAASVRSLASRVSRRSAASRASRRSAASRGSHVPSVRAATGMRKPVPPSPAGGGGGVSVATSTVDLEATEAKMRRILGRSWKKAYSEMRKSQERESRTVMSTHRFRDAMAEKGVPLTSKEVRALSKRYAATDATDPDAVGREVDYAALMRSAFGPK